MKGLVRVQACPPLPSPLLGAEAWVGADHVDAYRLTPLRRPCSPVDAFFALFGRRPAWMTLLMVLRHRVAAGFGLRVPSAADMWRPPRQAQYAPGDTLGAWPLFAINGAELVAGRNNAHLDFRVRLAVAPGALTVTTVCHAHHAAGRLYLRAILPFHGWGLRFLMRRAARRGWL